MLKAWPIWVGSHEGCNLLKQMLIELRIYLSQWQSVLSVHATNRQENYIALMKGNSLDVAFASKGGASPYLCASIPRAVTCTRPARQ